MERISVCTDNIIELLNMVIQFTKERQNILLSNIRFCDTPQYQPKDLDADGFSKQIDLALNEYLNYQRLLLCDSKTVRFGKNGSFKSMPVEDKKAARLLKNKDNYLKYQAGKLSQNATNAMVARRLIKARKNNETPKPQHLFPRDAVQLRPDEL